MPGEVVGGESLPARDQQAQSHREKNMQGWAQERKRNLEREGENVMGSFVHQRAWIVAWGETEAILTYFGK